MNNLVGGMSHHVYRSHIIGRSYGKSYKGWQGSQFCGFSQPGSSSSELAKFWIHLAEIWGFHGDSLRDIFMDISELAIGCNREAPPNQQPATLMGKIPGPKQIQSGSLNTNLPFMCSQNALWHLYISVIFDVVSWNKDMKPSRSRIFEYE